MCCGSSLLSSIAFTGLTFELAFVRLFSCSMWFVVCLLVIDDVMQGIIVQVCNMLCDSLLFLIHYCALANLFTCCMAFFLKQ